MKTYLVCPKCNSTDIAQYRNPEGPIWCLECGERDERKELKNRFIKTEEEMRVYEI